MAISASTVTETEIVCERSNSVQFGGKNVEQMRKSNTFWFGFLAF